MTLANCLPVRLLWLGSEENRHSFKDFRRVQIGAVDCRVNPFSISVSHYDKRQASSLKCQHKAASHNNAPSP